MAETGIVLLVMSSPERRLAIHRGLEGLASEIRIARNRREVHHLLHSHPPIDVVITDLILPDGTWLDILGEVVKSGIGANVVVTSPSANENLWSEILRLGGFDLLVEPYDRDRLKRVIDGAVQTARAGKEEVSPVEQSG